MNLTENTLVMTNAMSLFFVNNTFAPLKFGSSDTKSATLYVHFCICVAQEFLM